MTHRTPFVLFLASTVLPGRDRPHLRLQPQQREYHTPAAVPQLHPRRHQRERHGAVVPGLPPTPLLVAALLLTPTVAQPHPEDAPVALLDAGGATGAAPVPALRLRQAVQGLVWQRTAVQPPHVRAGLAARVRSQPGDRAAHARHWHA